MLKSRGQLQDTLARIDSKGYKAYKDVQGGYDLGTVQLFIDYVQGDPFAAPTRIRLRLPSGLSPIPDSWLASPLRRLAVEDFLARQVAHAISTHCRGHRGIGKSGLVSIDAGGQEVLPRTAVRLTPSFVEARMKIGLPAAGRRVLGRQAEDMLLRELPRVAQAGLAVASCDASEIAWFYRSIENQEFIRGQLEALGLIAFVGNGSILPRASGTSQRPLQRDKATPFRAPESLEVAFTLPHPMDPDTPDAMTIRGMGIPRGVSLIVGGGYHGKSTLLRALELGVYPHIPGDGREFVVTHPATVKIRAEDGRRVERLDISAFINDLPVAGFTQCFSTDDASGSTSQAANIMEALEVGARVFLLDEDTCATNFMVRDARMQALVHKGQEPITPFIDRVEELFHTFGVSTVVVMGGCGDYFDVADTVIKMNGFQPVEVTGQARAVARSIVVTRKNESPGPMNLPPQRRPRPDSLDASKGRRSVKIDVHGVDTVRFGHQTLDLRQVSQLVDGSQTRAVAFAMVLLAQQFLSGEATLSQAIDGLMEFLDTHGLDALDPFGAQGRHPGDFAMPRRFELAAAINRLRSLSIRT